MTTPATPKRSPSSKKRATPATKNVASRSRRTRKPAAAADSGMSPETQRSPHGSGSENTKRLSGQSEQLIIVVVALGFGLLGLAIHFLWIVSIVLMALLVGLIGAEGRRQRGHGLVAEVVAEARGFVEDIGKPVPGSGDEPARGPSPAPETDRRS